MEDDAWNIGLADLQQLLKQAGGETKYGYILRDVPTPEAPLIHEKYEPSRMRRRAEMAELGVIHPLGELASIVRGIHTSIDSPILLMAGDVQNKGVPAGQSQTTRVEAL